jgi:hypothetical protein
MGGRSVWCSCEGERVLQGAEWELFRVGLDEVWDYVEDSFDDDDCFPFGIAAFDDLQPGQKLAVLAQVGQALHDKAVPPPPLTAHAEATIAAVYVHIRQSVELEIDEQDVSIRRSLPSTGADWSCRPTATHTPRGAIRRPANRVTTSRSGTCCSTA